MLSDKNEQWAFEKRYEHVYKMKKLLGATKQKPKTLYRRKETSGE